jgi:hypothetical protein
VRGARWACPLHIPICGRRSSPRDWAPARKCRRRRWRPGLLDGRRRSPCGYVELSISS